MAVLVIILLLQIISAEETYDEFQKCYNKYRNDWFVEGENNEYVLVKFEDKLEALPYNINADFISDYFESIPATESTG